MKKPIKRLLPAILSFFLVWQCHAQNWDCLKPGIRQYFINHSGYLRGMRIDSTRVQGNLRFYFPFHTPRGRYEIPQNQQNYVLQPLDQNGGSWLGKSVKQLQDGTWLFDNYWGDTVVIKSQAHLGDNWTFYNDSTNAYYQATLSSVDTMTVLSFTDSVKTITLTAYRNANVNTNDPLNNASIILSKNHGFVQTTDLYMFPLREPDSTDYSLGFDYYTDRSGANVYDLIFKQVSFRNPDGFELYNYNTGDVFETETYTHCNLSRDLDTILARDSILPNEIRYIQHHIHQNYYYVPGPVATQGVDTFYVHSGTVMLIDTILMPEELGVHRLFTYSPHDSSHCSKSTIYQIADDMITENLMVNTFEPCGNSNDYKNGFGMVVSNFCDDATPCTQICSSMVFSFKNGQGQPCGQYTYLGLKNAIGRRSKLLISPNPANNYCNLNSDRVPYSIAMYNMLGQEVMERNCYNNIEVIDLTYLPPGVYQLRQTAGNDIGNDMLLEIQH